MTLLGASICVVSLITSMVSQKIVAGQYDLWRRPGKALASSPKVQALGSAARAAGLGGAELFPAARMAAGVLPSSRAIWSSGRVFKR